jgi:Phage integrase family
MIKRYSEKGNVRKGRFTPAEAEAVFNNLPPYMSDVARFAYETGHRSSEIRKLCWSHLEPDAIRVPGSITKNGEECQIVLTEEVEDILSRRKSDRRPGCDLIFHHDGVPIVDYRKCWRSACVCLGLGAYYCRDCRDAECNYTFKLDASKKCSCVWKVMERESEVRRQNLPSRHSSTSTASGRFVELTRLRVAAQLDPFDASCP